MDEEQLSADERLLAEARRTTHAVRAIARFIFIQVTYSLVAGVFGGIGALMVMGGQDEIGTTLSVIAVLLAVIGLFHATSAGWNELDLSRPAASAPVEVQRAPVDGERILNDRPCACSFFERGFGNTSVHEGREYCLRCFRYTKEN